MKIKQLQSLCLLLILLFCGSPLPAQDAKTTICIDPGHSKATVGTRGKRLIEYQICWKMANRLQAELTRRGYTVILTKPNQDANILNENRAKIANNAHAALLIRLHCDAGNEPGIATFYPNRQGNFHGIQGPSAAVMAASGQAAKRFHAALIKTLRGALNDRHIRTDAQTAVGSKQGALTGSIFSQVPVILVEMAVLQIPHDEAFLASESGQALLTQAMADGVEAAVKSKEDRKQNSEGAVGVYKFYAYILRRFHLSLYARNEQTRHFLLFSVFCFLFP